MTSNKIQSYFPLISSLTLSLIVGESINAQESYPLTLYQVREQTISTGNLPGANLLHPDTNAGSATDKVSLSDAFASARRHYPSILSALKNVEVAEANRFSAQGNWDLKLNSMTRKDATGYYENDYFETKLEQPTPYWGTRFFGGYRQGNGFFPVYEDKLETLNNGEFFTGFKAPILRDRAIDSARGEIQQADTLIEQTREELAFTELQLLTETALAYWAWVGAGLKLQVYEQLLEITRNRDEAVRENVRLGQAPEVEQVDNERLIIQRQASVVSARRYLEQTALKLSVYYRDTNGEPLTLPLTSSPLSIPELNPESLPDPDSSALFWADNHPEVKIFQKELELQSINLKLAKNQRLPSLDFTASVSRDQGDGSKADEQTEARFLLEFEFPFLNRKARGKIKSVEAKIESMRQKLRLMQDQAFVRIDNTYQALLANHQRVLLSDKELELALRLQQAEQDRVDLGQSNLLTLNLREQATIRASVSLIDAKVELLQNLALYQNARGMFDPDWTW